MQIERCGWCTQDPLYIAYHDTEWGVPVYEDKKLFEFLLLEAMQAGLSWLTVLRKRENFRHALDDFSVNKIANYTDKKINALLTNPGIIRSERKLRAAVNNAQRFLATQQAFGSFSNYLWQFTEGAPIQNTWQNLAAVPAESEISLALARDLKQRGFTFMGSITCYAYMQAIGLVNDHIVSCFRYQR